MLLFLQRAICTIFILASYSQIIQCFIIQYKSSSSLSTNTLNIVKRRESSKISLKNVIYRQSNRKQFSLYGLTDEDLPNLLGINPIEAAVLFGFLYYVYGPEELYNYAREAGKFAATYVPVIKDLAVNIYNEFKEYVDEDRERDELIKRGIDVSKFPRRTTNLIERVQASLEMFSEMTKADNSNNVIGGEAGIGLTPELFKGVDKLDKKEIRTNSIKDNKNNITSDTIVKTSRKTKKKILESKNIDVQKLIEYENSVAASAQLSGTQVEAELSKSINLVQEKLSSMATVNIPASNFPAPSNSLMNNNYNFNNNQDDDRSTFDEDNNYYFPDSTSLSKSSLPPTSPTTTSLPSPFMSPSQLSPNLAQTPDQSTEGMSKFQLQMSGLWNQKVLESSSSSSSFMNNNNDNDNNSDWGTGNIDWNDPTPLTSLPTNNVIDDSPSPLVANTASEQPSAASTGMYNEYGMPMDLDISETSSVQTVQVSPSAAQSFDNDIDSSLSSSSSLLTVTKGVTSVAPIAIVSIPSSSTSPLTTSATRSGRPALSFVDSSGVSGSEGLIPDTVSKVLEELDRDYQTLRNKLINAILTVEMRSTEVASVSSSPSLLNTNNTLLNSLVSTNSNSNSYIDKDVNTSAQKEDTTTNLFSDNNNNNYGSGRSNSNNSTTISSKKYWPPSFKT